MKTTSCYDSCYELAMIVKKRYLGFHNDGDGPVFLKQPCNQQIYHNDFNTIIYMHIGLLIKNQFSS